jgi:uncharacterized membrane protein
VSVLLAVLSALVWGTADYIGGQASRRAESTVVTLTGQTAGLLAVLIVIPMVGDALPPAADWGYGFLAGAFGAVALMCFYRALATGAMTVVAPIAGVTCALVPAVWGLSTGDRPSGAALVGVGVALVAIALVSGAGARSQNPGERLTPRSAHLLALVAGLGFGLLSVALSYTSGEGGLWPVVAMRCTSLPLTAVVATVTRMSAALLSARMACPDRVMSVEAAPARRRNQATLEMVAPATTSLHEPQRRQNAHSVVPAHSRPVRFRWSSRSCNGCPNQRCYKQKITIRQ